MYQGCRRDVTIRPVGVHGTIRPVFGVFHGMIRPVVTGRSVPSGKMDSAAANFVERSSGLLVSGPADPLVLAHAFEHELRGRDRRVRLLLAAEGRLAAHAALAGCTGDHLGSNQRGGPCFVIRAFGWLEPAPLF